MDLVFDSSSGDFDKASFMAVYGDKIHEKFPELKAVLADLIDEGELDARLIERLSAP